MAYDSYIFNESTFTKYCNGTKSPPNSESDYKDLCSEILEWPGQVCDVDPISQDDIPAEYRLRFRIRTSPGHSVLACRDVRMLKQLIDQDGPDALDPIHRLPYSRELYRRIIKHPAIKSDTVPYDFNMLTEDITWSFASAVYAYRPEYLIIGNHSFDGSMRHKRLSRYVLRGIILSVIFFAFWNREIKYQYNSWTSYIVVSVVGALLGSLYYYNFVYEPDVDD